MNRYISQAHIAQIKGKIAHGRSALKHFWYGGAQKLTEEEIAAWRASNKAPNGFLPVKYKGQTYRIWGGPYPYVPNGMVGVKMAAEIQHRCQINIPTPDFSTPDVKLLKQGIADALVYLEKGHDVYVGCMAGRGRTGLFMAALMQFLGEKDPVGYVRKHYYSHAVETDGQKSFVENLKFGPSEMGARFLNSRKRYEKANPPPKGVLVRRWIKKQLIALANAI